MFTEKKMFLKLLLLQFLLTSSIFSDSQKIPILYWSDFGGKYINFSENSGNYIQKLKVIEYLQNIYPIENGGEKALFFHNGPFFFPDSSARYILNQDGGANIILTLLKKSGADIYSFHRKDFYTPYPLLQKISNIVDDYDIKFLISNLSCSNLENPICKMRDSSDFKIVKSGGIKIAVFSFVDSDILKKVSIKTSDGLSLISPETIIEKNIPILKEKNIDSIFIISSIDWKTTEQRGEFLERFPQIGLMIDSESDMKIEESFSHKTVIVGKDRASENPQLIIGEKKEDSSKIDFYAISYKEKNSYSPFDDIFNNKLEQFRKKYFTSDLGVKLSKEIDYSESINFILDFLKTKVKTELLIVNREMFLSSSSKLFPFKAVDSSFMQKIIRFNEPLYTLEMKGDELEGWIKKYKSNKNLIFHGVTGDSNSLFIDEFPFVKERVYRVTMSRFLFFGGDGYFENRKYTKNDLNESKKERVEISKEIYEIWFDNYPILANKTALSLDEFRKSLSNFHFEFKNRANLSFYKGGVENNSLYTDPIFSRLSTSEVTIEFSSFLGATSKNHIWDQEFLVNYALLKENEQSYKEKSDLLSYRINYKNRHFKKKRSLFIIPLPYAEAKVETEIDKPDDRDYHNLNGIFSLGASFLTQTQRFELKFAGAVSKQLLAENEQTQYGISIGYMLKPIEFLKVTWESYFDYFISFSDKKQEKGSWQGNLYIPIFKNFYTFTKGTFKIYKEEKSDYSYIYDLTFGLTLMWSSWF